MDCADRDIEIVEDDMGEGCMEPINEKETKIDREQRQLWRLEEQLKRKMKR